MSNMLRFKDSQVEFAEVEAYKRVDQQLKEILQKERASYTANLPKGQMVADQLVKLLKERLVVQRHFVTANTTRNLDTNIKMAFNLHVVFKMAEDRTAKWMKSRCNSNILHSVYFVLNSHSVHYKVEKPSDSFVEVTELESGIKLYLLVAATAWIGEDVRWESIKSLCSLYPFSSMVPKCFVDTYRARYLKQSANKFTQDVVTLAKLWNENFVASQHIPQQAAIVEILATKAARCELSETKTKGFLSEAMERFFSYFSADFTKLRVNTSHDCSTGIYDRLDDPGSGNNYSEAISSEQRQKLSCQAKLSLNLMSEVKCGNELANRLFGL